MIGSLHSRNGLRALRCECWRTSLLECPLSGSGVEMHSVCENTASNYDWVIEWSCWTRQSVKLLSMIDVCAAFIPKMATSGSAIWKCKKYSTRMFRLYILNVNTLLNHNSFLGWQKCSLHCRRQWKTDERKKSPGKNRFYLFYHGPYSGFIFL